MAETESPLMSLFHPSRYAPVRERLLLVLDGRTLVRLAQTSRAMRNSIMSAWDVNARLRCFFDDPVAFRTKLGQCDALIAGSFALQFFEGVVWRESDLDIEVRVGPNLDAMHDYLTGDGGYRLSPDDQERGTLARDRSRQGGGGGSSSSSSIRDKVPYASRDVVECRSYYRRRGAGTAVKAQLIATRDVPVQSVLRCYYTSCLVNFLTWNKAFSVFPRATFAEHATVPLKRLDPQEQRYHDKYRARGWRVRGRPALLPRRDGDEGGDGGVEEALGEFVSRVGDEYAHRRLGDRYTWVLPLDTAGITGAESFTPDYVMESSCFQIYKPWVLHPETTMDWCKIHAEICTSSVLRYRYVQGIYEGWQKIWPKLRAFELRQLGNLDPRQLVRVERAVHSYSGMYSAHDHPWEPLHIVTPAGWVYVDDWIPGLVRPWIEEQQRLPSPEDLRTILAGRFGDMAI